MHQFVGSAQLLVLASTNNQGTVAELDHFGDVHCVLQAFLYSNTAPLTHAPSPSRFLPQVGLGEL
jgi:hypothetical protein